MDMTALRPTGLLASGLAAALLLLAAPAAAQNAPAGGKTIYCWDEDGRRVCGDALPASAVEAARTEMSTSGLTQRRLDRALTDAERAQAEAADAAARDAEREAASRARREQAMVESYSSEAELQQAFGNRIGVIEAGIETARLGIQSTRASLVGLLQRAGEAELAGRPVPKALADNILNQHRSLRQLQAQIDSQVRQRREADEDLADALARYRELKIPGGKRG